MGQFKLTLLAISLLFLPFLQATDFKYCDKERNYAVKVSGIEISPNPVARGKPATFTISASTEEEERRREEDRRKDERREELGINEQGLGIGDSNLGIEARESYLINLPDEMEQANGFKEGWSGPKPDGPVPA